jgi:hypothetical protein
MAEVRESYLMKIAHPTDPARIWSGVGDLYIPTDALVETTAGPHKYLGAGELLSIPDFQQLINGVAERLELVVSGVNDETVRLAVEDAPGVRNAPVYIGRIDFDENWQPIGVVEWEATFRADFLVVDSEASGGFRIRTIKLSIGTDDTGRAFAPAAYFTDADQRQRSATDEIFSNVARLNRGTSRVFGPRYVESSGGFF